MFLCSFYFLLDRLRFDLARLTLTSRVEKHGQERHFHLHRRLRRKRKNHTGTTTNREALQKYNAVYTAEPSQGKIGTFIRECCLYEGKRLPTEAEALLFAADRIEHVQNEVAPALAEGKIVICDRYIYSSLAYQGSAGLSLAWIKTINARALQPDFSIFIDVSPERVLERLQEKEVCDGNVGNTAKSSRSLPKVR